MSNNFGLASMVLLEVDLRVVVVEVLVVVRMEMGIVAFLVWEVVL